MIPDSLQVSSQTSSILQDRRLGEYAQRLFSNRRSSNTYDRLSGIETPL
jgi:hypothetical protein